MFKNVGYKVGSAISIFGQIDSGGDTKNISSYACLVFSTSFLAWLTKIHIKFALLSEIKI